MTASWLVLIGDCGVPVFLFRVWTGYYSFAFGEIWEKTFANWNRMNGKWKTCKVKKSMYSKGFFKGRVWYKCGTSVVSYYVLIWSSACHRYLCTHGKVLCTYGVPLLVIYLEYELDVFIFEENRVFFLCKLSGKWNFWKVKNSMCSKHFLARRFGIKHGELFSVHMIVGLSPLLVHIWQSFVSLRCTCLLFWIWTRHYLPLDKCGKESFGNSSGMNGKWNFEK